MAFPASSILVPYLQPYQFNYRGYTFGPETALELTSVEGIDLPVVRTGDAGRPRTHGLFTGLDVLGGREITIKGQLQKDSVSFQHALEELATATVPGGMTEEPLFIGVPGYGTLACMARIRKRQTPWDIKFALGNLADITLLFAASDPRLYAPTQVGSVSATGVSSGFGFPMGFLLAFGGGSSAGVLTVENTGNIDVAPILTVEGPCPSPSITNATVEGDPNLTFDMTMNAGDKLVIETDLKVATYYTSGTTVGSIRTDTLAPGSQWFVMGTGPTEFQFTSQNGEGGLAVEWAPAYLP